jgi:hypothetical protein
MTPDQWSTMGSAIIGGLIGGGFAALAAWQAHRHNLSLEAIQLKKRIDGILEAMRCELTVIRAAYDNDIGKLLRNVKEGQSYNGHFSMMEEKYFIVYPSNTDVVGQIEDNELVKSIVATYTKANLLIETFRMNNWLIERTEQLQDKRGEAYSELTTIQEPNSEFTRTLAIARKSNLEAIMEERKRSIDNYFEERVGQTKLLKELDADLHKETDLLLARIDGYRKKHPIRTKEHRSAYA